ncbi:MAG: hypothetical protein H6933_07670 [Burkholderiaceae bacterium]|nr:hypothetical protein [Rhodoferax sp.]MCP5284759.1 hypothetical protein [Burkholderiaceae bacterium]
MRLIDHFDEALVLRDAGTGTFQTDHADALCASLRARGITTWCVDLAAVDPWRIWPGRTDGDPVEAGRGPGLLILDGRLPDADRLWSTQDGLVEQLESGVHPLVVLVHADGGLAHGRPSGPRLLPTDGVPSRPLALAVGRRLLRGLLDLLPDHGREEPLTAEDWLTMATWMAPVVTPGLRRALAWPSVSALVPLPTRLGALAAC